MSFTKYPSIENHYRSKEIALWLEYHPELAQDRFIAQCKVDGSNLALWFLPDGRIKVASRSNFIGYLGDDVRFQGVAITELFKSNDVHEMFVSGFTNMAQKQSKTFVVFGELFGKGIQNRIYYGPDRYWRSFDISVDGEFIAQCTFENWLIKVCGHDGYEVIACPQVEMFDTLEEALNFNVVFPSVLTPEGYEKPNFEEGVVLKPYYNVYQSPQGSVFYLKKKNPKFADKKEKKEKIPVDAGLLELQTAFRSYLNENRLLDIFSKYGAIEKPSQIGEYIRYMLEDAKADFLKDYPYSGDKNADKVVFNAGTIIVDMLKEKM